MKDISIDLHLHLDGSLSLMTVRRLAEMQGIEIPESDVALKPHLTVSEGCGSLAEYLEKFDFPLALLQTESAIEEAVYLLCRELLAEGCIYAEIRFAPQLHLNKGLTQGQVVSSAIRGFERARMLGGLILCCMRGEDNYAQNLETVSLAKAFLGKGVLALDLAGNEAGYPTEDFAELFDKASRLEVPFTIHAGEADGAESVRKAIEMGAARIGHGVRSIEDEALVKLLADKKIPLELCPTSNLNTAVFSDIAEYPIRELMDAGVIVTVNSDNRSVSNTTAAKEMQLLSNTFEFGKAEQMTLLMSSVSAAFCDSETKERIICMLKEKSYY